MDPQAVIAIHRLGVSVRVSFHVGSPGLSGDVGEGADEGQRNLRIMQDGNLNVANGQCAVGHFSLLGAVAVIDAIVGGLETRAYGAKFQLH